MSKVLLKLGNLSFCENVNPAFAAFVRNGHHLRGKPPGIARSLQQRLAEINYKDPTIYYKVDIGLPPLQQSKSAQLQERIKHLKEQRQDAKLEKLARTKQLLIDVDKSYEDWLKTVGPQHIKTVAEHYGVFEHLFGDAYFLPQVPLSISFDSEDIRYPVYYGNVIKPENASAKPEVTFANEKDSLWTLILTNPDGHLTDNDKEYVHWFVGNIPGNNLKDGETIVDYMQPIPPKGTGYHRHVFILYKQNKKLDFSQYKKSAPRLNDRTFKTYDFYRSLQDEITPAGLAFFQSDWTLPVKQYYHKVLDMKEPIYEYDFPPPYYRKQAFFPKRQPFNIYMDRYRDQKQINKEFLLKKLKNVHPFKAPEPPLPYPNAQSFDRNVPTWLRTELRKERLKLGRINEIE